MQAPGTHDDERDTHHLHGEEPRREAAAVKNAPQVGREQQPACPTCGLHAPPQHDCIAELVTYAKHQAEKLRAYAEVLEKCAYCPARLTGEAGQGSCSRCLKGVCKDCEYDGILTCIICS